MPAPNFSAKQLADFQNVQQETLQKYGSYSCSVCEENISYQARSWDFCSGCGSIAHRKCLSNHAPVSCFRCGGSWSNITL